MRKYIESGRWRVGWWGRRGQRGQRSLLEVQLLSLVTNVEIKFN